MINSTNLIQKKKVIFLHIPKAGGSTLIDILRTVYTKQKVVHVFPNGKIKKDHQLAKLTSEEFDLIVGHFKFGIHKFVKFPIQYITVLRNPIERLISHYNYAKKNKKHYLYNEINNGLTLADYLLSPISKELENGQVRLLSNSNKPIGEIDRGDLEIAKQNLRNFFIYGTLEDWDTTLNRFKINLGWKEIPEYSIRNTGVKKSMKLTKLEYKRILEINKYDMALYKFVQNQKSVERPNQIIENN